MNLLLALGILATAAFAPVAMAQGTGLFARVASVTGSAVLSNGNAAAGFALTRGYALSPGDRVDTRQGGRVVIDLSDGSLVVVQPGTVLTIKDFRGAASVRELFEILLGVVRVKIHHLTGKPNPYRMNSPTASIAVRGTEFDVVVGEDGNTRVDVFEGAVEVGRLDDPGDRALIEAGRGVLVRPGQPLQLIGIPIAKASPAPRPGPDKATGDHTGTQAQPRLAGQRAPGPMPSPRSRFPSEPERAAMARAYTPREQSRNEALLSAERSEPQASLIAAVETPLLYRFNAFPDVHLDTYENPAYAAGTSASEARATLYRFSPQLSVLQSVGKGFVAGGSITGARSGTAGLRSFQSAAVTDASFSSFSAFTAKRFGRAGVGLSVEKMRNSQDFEAVSFSDFVQTQTRVTAGLTTRVGKQMDAGAYVRYGLIDAETQQQTLRTGNIPVFSTVAFEGQAKEAGVRLRGVLKPRLSFGLSANLGASRLGPTEWRTRSFAAGVGYRATPGTLLALDTTAGTMSAGSISSPFQSVHISMQRDVTKRLFASVSFLNVWRNNAVALPLWRTKYADLAVGWRFSPDWMAQYVVTRDNVFSRPQHGVALRYTFQWRELARR